MCYILTPLKWDFLINWLFNTINPSHSSLVHFISYWSRFLFLDFFSVLVLYCCVPNHPKIWQLKKTNIYYLTVSVGQEFGCSLSLNLRLKVPHKFVAKPSAWAVVSTEGSSEDSFHAHSCDCWQDSILQAVGPRASVPRWLLVSCLTLFLGR